MFIIKTTYLSWKLYLLFLFGLIARLLLAYYFYGNFDQDSYEIVAEIMKKGGNVFLETARYNYTPLWSYILLLLNFLSELTGLSYHFVVRTFLTLIDFTNAFLIGLIGKYVNPKSFNQSFIAYWLNPVAILIVGYHGQFDTLAMLPILIAVYLTEKNIAKYNSLWIWLLGTLSIIIKHITIFGVFVLFFNTSKNKLQAFLLSFASLMAFLFTFIPYIPSSKDQILNNVFRYQGLGGFYGLSSFIPPLIAYSIFYFGMVLIVIFSHDLLQFPIPKAVGFSFVAFLAITHGIGEQYFLLPVHWGSIYRSKWFWLFSTVAGIFLLGSGNNLNIPGIPTLWNGVWLVSVGWCLSILLSKNGNPFETLRNKHRHPDEIMNNGYADKDCN